jgi:hypothetical protein
MNTAFRLENHIEKAEIRGYLFICESGQLNRYSDGLLAGLPGFDSRKGQETFLYSTALRPSLAPTQPLMGTDGSFPGVTVAGV